MNSSEKARAQGKPGNSGPAAFAFFCPGPQLRNFTKKISLASNTKPSARPAPTRRSGAEGSDGRFLRSQLRRIGPGRCPQARPCRQRPHPITTTSADLAKPELSTLHKIGTFYFALTESKQARGQCTLSQLVEHSRPRLWLGWSRTKHRMTTKPQ
jgi:hypothetical protein